MKKEIFTNPDGSKTTDVQYYISNWNDLTKPLCDAVGCHVVGYDPDVLFSIPQEGFDSSVYDISFNIPTTVLLKLNKALNNNVELTCEQVDRYFEKRKQIAHIWSVADVREFVPELSDEDCYSILEMVYQGLDSSIGITWDVLKIYVERFCSDNLI